MKIKTFGPNLVDQSKGGFHVHAADCNDCKKAEYKRCDGGRTEEFTTKREVVEDVYADIIADNEGDEHWGGWESYLQEFHFFPCCDSLPTETTETNTDQEVNTMSNTEKIAEVAQELTDRERLEALWAAEDRLAAIYPAAERIAAKLPKHPRGDDDNAQSKAVERRVVAALRTALQEITEEINAEYGEAVTTLKG